jgi:hypothetical protein
MFAAGSSWRKRKPRWTSRTRPTPPTTRTPTTLRRAATRRPSTKTPSSCGSGPSSSSESTSASFRRSRSGWPSRRGRRASRGAASRDGTPTAVAPAPRADRGAGVGDATRRGGLDARGVAPSPAPVRGRGVSSARSRVDTEGPGRSRSGATKGGLATGRPAHIRGTRSWNGDCFFCFKSGFFHRQGVGLWRTNKAWFHTIKFRNKQKA